MRSDERLTRRAIEGDQRAFSAIFRRYHQGLYRYCLALAGNPQDAEDALQNTMVKALRALPGEERQIELKPWLYRIAHNESIEVLRRRRPAEQLDPELVIAGAGPAEESAQRERLRQLIADLQQLPERQRGTLVMRELGGLDFAEIGAALGTSAAVARQTLYEARLGLRQMDSGREMSCETVMKALSDADGRVVRRRDIRAHLRTCDGCRGFREEIEGRERDLAALSPLPAAAAAGLLQGLLGGHGAGGGGLAAGSLGGGAAKTLGASAALKGAAAVAVVAAVGVTAADRGGLVHVGPWGHDSSAPSSPVRRLTPAGELERRRQIRRVEAGRRASARSLAPRIDASRVDGARATADPGRPTANTTTGAPAPATNPSAEHPSGRGHEKQLPAASSHGQETASAHKAPGGGQGKAQAHPVHPTKSTHPVHPSNPGSEKAAPAAPAHGHEPPAQPEADPQPDPEAAPPGHENSEKP